MASRNHVTLSRRRRFHDGVTSLGVVMSNGSPPDEFRIFTAGTVDTVKGQFIFDEAAAKSVMAEYQAHGIDLMIDYDHASLGGTSADPALAARAAGWFNLEVRNGELWAVNVRFTEAASAALKAKEWRFVSPAFQTEGDRIVSLMNVAIVNLPATRRLDPLMAANIVKAGGSSMTLEEMMKVAEALDLGPDATLDDFLAKIGAMKNEEKKPEDKPADKPDPKAELGLTEEEKPEEVAAALSAVRSLSGKTSFVGSIADIRTWHASHLAHETNMKVLAAREALIESAERRKIYTELVTLGGRSPATVWESPDSQTPKAYLAAMPIAGLRAMHADTIAASGSKAAAIKPPVVAAADGKTSFDTPNGVVTLSARELSHCAEMKVDPKDYAARKPVRKD